MRMAQEAQVLANVYALSYDTGAMPTYLPVANVLGTIIERGMWEAESTHPILRSSEFARQVTRERIERTVRVQAANLDSLLLSTELDAWSRNAPLQYRTMTLQVSHGHIGPTIYRTEWT